MSDMGVINIINNRTGKKYTAGSTNIDQLMNQYKNKIEHAHHHNEELRKDAEKGDTFRFEVVSRNCKTEDEIRALRDSEIYRNRNNTYNKDVPIHFDGGNPNAEYPHVSETERLNNVEGFTYPHTPKKPKRDAQKEYEEYAKKLRESNSLKISEFTRSRKKQQKNKIRFGGNKARYPKKEKTESEREREEKINKKNLIEYVDKFKSSTSDELRNEIIKEINDNKITTKTQIVKRLTKELDMSHTYKTHHTGKTTIVNFKERRERKEEAQKRKEEAHKRKLELKRKELFKYLDKFKSSISDDLRNEIIDDINKGKTITKIEILKRVTEGKKNKKNFREQQEIEEKNKIINNIQEIDNKLSSIGFYYPDLKKQLESEREIKLNKLKHLDYNEYLELKNSYLKEELLKYVDDFPISEELNKELKIKINENIITNKRQIASIAIETRKNERLKNKLEAIDIEMSQLKKEIQQLQENLDKLEDDKKQLDKEYFIMGEELFNLEYKKIFELEKSSLGKKSRLNRKLKQLERKREKIVEELKQT